MFSHFFRSVSKKSACVIFSLTAAAGVLTGLPQETQVKTKRVTAGKHYSATYFHRILLGSDYRDLWTTPIAVEVLDLQKYAGGLRPKMRVGGMQTLGLALEGTDGCQYTFRGLDKDPTSVLPPSFSETLAARLIQDQTAAAHPAGAVMVSPLAEAIGILHCQPKIVLMPDDPALGEFREAFAGALGTIQEFPCAQPISAIPTFGAEEIISGKDMWNRMRAGSETRADSRAFLKARLLDLLIGDWDRHPGQWRWAKIPGKDRWQPIPEDRDQAFADYGGLILSWVRLRNPQLLRFKDRFPGMEGSTWNGRELDRLVLVEIEKPEWMDIAAAVKDSVTDDVIEKAIRLMPEEYYVLSGAKLASLLKSRRDRLVDAAEKYYQHLAGDIDIHGTDQDDEVNISCEDDGTVAIRVSPSGVAGTKGSPYFQRRFLAGETGEIRIYLHGGQDRVKTTAAKRARIKIMVIGGPGWDIIEDSEHAGIHVYDDSGEDQVKSGRNTSIDLRPYSEPIQNAEHPWEQARDWGRRTAFRLWPGFSTDIGLFVGGGIFTEGYGFRKFPNADSHLLRLGYATGANQFRLEYIGQFRPSNTPYFSSLHLRASGIEILRFYGYGNESPADRPNRFFLVKQNQFSFFPSLNYQVSPSFKFFTGLELKFSRSALDSDTLIGILKPYGTRSFGQMSLRLGFDLDTRDPGRTNSQGIHLSAQGSFFPTFWHVEERFGRIEGQAAAFVPLHERLLFAWQVGGRKVYGTFPFHEAAYIGGSTTVRGFRKDRFAGDASLFSRVELRAILGKALIILPGEFGMFGLFDIGRVFFKGESSNTWHPATGGGVFFSIVDLATTFSLTVAGCEEGVSVYFNTGFSF